MTQTSFRHVVGKSTLKEGFTIPKAAEELMGAPETPGQSIAIRLLFEGQSVTATMRRLRNERGHVQVKYENADGQLLRNWLLARFGTAPGNASGAYIEVVRSGPNELEVIPFPPEAVLFPHLVVHDWLFHGGAERLFEQEGAMCEIPAVLRTVQFDDEQGQNHYNAALSAGFRDWNWEYEGRVIPELGLKFDFGKDGVQVEVEFGNARSYYQDYVKFLLAHRRGIANVGVLLVPTEPFAKHLCDVGRRRAIEKGRNRYSGMIHFAKVRREFEHLEFLLRMPVAIAGIGPS